MASVHSVVLHAARPESAMCRARRYSEQFRAKAGQAGLSPPTSLVASLSDDAFLELVTVSSLSGELVELRTHLDGFDERMQRLGEPTVALLTDASKACTGALYDLRGQLAALRV